MCSLNKLSSTLKSQFPSVFDFFQFQVQLLFKFSAQQSAMLVLASFWPDRPGQAKNSLLPHTHSSINFPAVVSHDYSVISLALNNIFCPKKWAYNAYMLLSLVLINPILPGGVRHHPWGFLPITQRGRKIIQSNLVTFLKIYRNLLKGKSLSVDPSLLPCQHFLGGALRKNQVLQKQ